MNPSTKPAATAPEAEAPQAPAARPWSPSRSTETASLLDLIVDEDTKRQLVKIEVQHKQFEFDQRIAEVMFAAGYFYSGGDDSKNKMTLPQALAKIEIGRAWSMDAATSIQRIYIVNGKPSIENEYYAAKMMDAGWSWEPEFINGQGPKCQGCRLWIFKDGKEKVSRDGTPLFVEFTFEMAEAAKLLEKSGPWKQYRGNMMYWRAVANLRRFYCPNVLTGALMVQEALDMALEDLEVSARGETPTPGERLSTSEKLDVVTTRRRKRDDAVKKGTAIEPKFVETDPAAGETKPAEDETKTPDPDTKAADPETERKTIAPVSADQLKVIRKYEGHLGSDAYYALLSDFDLKRPEQINSFEVAERVIARMAKENEALQTKAAGKPA